jgi:hypothetical protein
MVEEQIYTNTYRSLKGLIDNCYYTQATYPPIVFDTSYLKEFCTIRMQTARRSGHTTAICQVAYEYFRRALILFYNHEMSQRTKAYFAEVCAENGITKNIEVGLQYPKTKDKFVSKASSFIRVDDSDEYCFGSVNSIDNLKGFEFEAIFVDCAFMLSKKKEDKIYETLAPCMAKYPEKFFIFVE